MEEKHDQREDEPRSRPGGSAQLVVPPRRAPEPRIHTLHLLDTDSDVLLHLFEFLSNAGFQVSASSKPEDAMEFVARESPEVLIAATSLGVMTWCQLVERVRVSSPETRIILMSDRMDWPVTEEVNRCGGAGLVARPPRGVAVLRAVERALGKPVQEGGG